MIEFQKMERFPKFHMRNIEIALEANDNTYQKVGDKYKLTRETVRGIYTRLLRKLLTQELKINLYSDSWKQEYFRTEKGKELILSYKNQFKGK